MTLLRLSAVVLALTMVGSACQSADTTTNSGVTPSTAESASTQSADAPETGAEATAPSETTEALEPTATSAPTPRPTLAPMPEPSPTSIPAAHLIDTALKHSYLVDAPCPASLSDDRIDCFRATLPLRVESPDDGDTVQLLVAWVDNGDSAGSGPVVYLQGGPGVGAVSRASSWAGTTVDAIFFDQRGSGESTPKLDCPETDTLWQQQLTDDESQRVGDEVLYEAFEKCADRLQTAGVDLDAFHTSAVAADVELLRRLFEFEPWTLWGISYGTRVALTLMRDHPQGVRGAVLDSVVPFEIDLFSEIPASALRSFDALDAACDATDCASERGDFASTLETLAHRLDEAPAVVSVTRPISGEVFDMRITGGDLMNFVFQQMYSTRQLRALPRQIAGFDFGGVEEIVFGYVQRRDPDQFDLASALYYTTWCREEFAFHDPSADHEAIATGTERFGTGFDDALGSDGIDRLCEIFSVAPAPEIDDRPLASDIPAIVFAGAFDPITPPAWSLSVADRLPNATYVEMPDHGHGMTGPCSRSLFLAFVEDPMAELDLTCVSSTDPPDFE